MMMTTQPPLPTIPTGNALSDDDRLDRLMRAADGARKRFFDYLDSQPTSRPCVAHPHHTAVLNREKSINDWHHQTNKPLHKWSPVYICGECVQAAREAAFRQVQINAGLPLDVLHATLTNFETDRPDIDSRYVSPAQFVAFAQAFAERRISTLILGGGVGIGKGHLVAALANQRLKLGHGVKFLRAQALFDAVHRSYGAKAFPTKAQIVDECSDVALLILDEVALKDLPADGEDILFPILDARHQRHKQVLMTTNQPYAALKPWFGERCWDRLNDHRHQAPVYLYGQWRSMRGDAGRCDHKGLIESLRRAHNDTTDQL